MASTLPVEPSMVSLPFSMWPRAR